MAVTVLFKARRSKWIFLCHGCQSLLKAHERDLQTKVVTLSYDGSDRYERKYVSCPVCGAEHSFPELDRALY